MNEKKITKKVWSGQLMAIRKVRYVKRYLFIDSLLYAHHFFLLRKKSEIIYRYIRAKRYEKNLIKSRTDANYVRVSSWHWLSQV